MKNPYRTLGIVLTVAGAVLSPVFYFVVGSPALTATGISAIILGLTSAAIAGARPYLSPEAAQILLETGMDNIAALLEELGLHHTATYLPPATDGRSCALVPLENIAVTQLIPAKIPQRLVVRYGPDARDMAIAVTTAGNVSIRLLETKPGPTPSEIETALNYLLTGVLDIASGADVNLSGNILEVVIDKPRKMQQSSLLQTSLGSPIASIAAAVAAQAMKRPVRIIEEKNRGGRCLITLEVMG